MTLTTESRTAGLIRPLVLLVDDDHAVLEALRTLLAPRLEPVYRVETAASAEEALSLVADTRDSAPPVASAAGGERPAPESPIVLVVSDERMPGQSGTDLLIALRESRAHRHGGRIIVTAYAGLASAKRAINEAEVDRYFPKPWDAEGALLPAVTEILMRFAEKSGLDRMLLCGPEDFGPARQDILGVRKAWWEYVELMGIPVEEAGVEVPSFEEDADGTAVHVVVRRLSPREDVVAGALRLRGIAGAKSAVLEALAFLPAEASDETEGLLVRTAVLQAARDGIEAVSVEIPILRRPTYEGLGFRVAEDRQGNAPARITMTIATRTLAEAAGSAAAYSSRYRSEDRLCGCSQKACARHDYASASRGYFCPLDVLEGRTPEGFLGRREG